MKLNPGSRPAATFRPARRAAAWPAASCLALALLAGTPAHAVSITLRLPAITSRQVSIAWSTDVPATTELHWGPAKASAYADYPNHSIVESGALSTFHGRTLSHLAPGTYYFRARAVAPSGEAAVSEERAVNVPNEYETFVPFNFLVFDGPVQAMDAAGDAVYVGGTFREVGVRTGPATFVDPGSGAARKDLPQMDGRVWAAIPDGEGGLFVGGDFEHVGGRFLPYLVRLGPDGSPSNLTPMPPSGPVRALALRDGVLYVGMGPPYSPYAVAYDVAARTRTAWDPNADGPVLALAVTDDAVYLGGSFTQVGGESHLALAAVDRDLGAPTGWNPAVNGSEVRALLVQPPWLFVGGHFYGIDGGSSFGLSQFDLASGQITPWAPVANMGVSALAVWGGKLVVGGDFRRIALTSHPYAAAFDLATLSLDPWQPPLDGPVRALLPTPSALYVAGEFTSIGGVARRGVAAFDSSLNPLPWSIDLNGPATTLAMGDAGLFVGGSFTAAATLATRSNAAAVDRRTGALLPWAPAFDGPVTALRAAGEHVYVAGGFSTVDGAPRAGLARVAQSGALDAWDAQPDGAIRALEADAAQVYFAGDFAQFLGSGRTGLAAVEASTGALAPWAPYVAGGPVYVMKSTGSRIHLGGDFAAVNHRPLSNLAEVDTGLGIDAPRVLATTDQPIRALASDGSRLFLGGDFTTVGLFTSHYFDAVDVATGAELPVFPNVNGPVRTLALVGQDLVIGGGLAQELATPNGFAMQVDAATGAARTWGGPMDGVVEALAADCASRTIWMQGRFFNAWAEFQPSLAAFRVGGLCEADAPPTIVDNQADDPSWQRAPGALYDVDFADDRGLASFELVGFRGASGYQVVQALTPAGTLSGTSWTQDWPLPPSFFAGLQEGVTRVGVLVVDSSRQVAELLDAFTLSKDTLAPAGGPLSDGSAGEIDFQETLDGLAANWPAFTDATSGLAQLSWSIGTSPGASDALAEQALALDATSAAATLLLVPGRTYFVNVRALDVAGNEALVSSDGVTVETTPPTAGAVRDGAGPDVAWQPVSAPLEANWSEFEDAESGPATYEWALGSSPGAQDLLPFTAVGRALAASDSTAPRAECQRVFATVRAMNGAGMSTVASSDGVSLAPATPGTAGVVEDGPSADVDYQADASRLSARWSAFAAACGIEEYQWAVGSAPEGEDVLAFTSAGLARSASASLALQTGVTYYASVRARTAGGWLQAASDGVMVDATAPGPGAVAEGGDPDVDLLGPAPSLAARWSGFDDPESGVAAYEWAIGSRIGGQEVQPYTSVGTATSAAWSGTLVHGGGYFVSVRARNRAGLFTEAFGDGVLVDLTPPVAGAVFDGADVDLDELPSGAPVVVSWSGFDDPESGIASYAWALGTGPGGEDLQRFTDVGLATAATFRGTLAAGARVFATVRATNPLGASVELSSDGVTVLGPEAPRIVSEPSRAARCTVPYSYAAAASGATPLRWRLEGPADARIDEATGALTWTPAAGERGIRRFALWCSNAGGETQQSFDVQVDCATALEFSMGCASAGARGKPELGGLLPLVIALLVARRSTRRREAGGRCR